MKDLQSSTIFVSPSIEEDGDLAEALDALTSTSQAKFEASAHNVSSWVAPGTLVRRSLGVWDDGAEPSACLEVPRTATLDDLQYIAALLGVEFYQKDVFVFTPASDGRDLMHHFTADAPILTLAEECQLADIGNRTYVLETGGYLEVFVFDNRFDPELPKKIATITEAYGYHLHTTTGTGRFLTRINDSREQARRIFLDLIREFERRYPDRKYSSSAG